MTEEELLKIFNTLSPTGGHIKGVRLISENKIYLVMFDEPDLIFYFKDMKDWSLQTAVNYVRGIPNGQDSNILLRQMQN